MTGRQPEEISESEDDGGVERQRMLKLIAYPDVEKDSPSQACPKITKCLGKRIQKLSDLNDKFGELGKKTEGQTACDTQCLLLSSALWAFVGTRFFIPRMHDKLQSHMALLTSTDEEIEQIYAQGVVHGFSKECLCWHWPPKPLRFIDYIGGVYI